MDLDRSRALFTDIGGRLRAAIPASIDWSAERARSFASVDEVAIGTTDNAR